MIDPIYQERSASLIVFLLSALGPALLLSRSRKLRNRAPFALLLAICASCLLGVRTVVWGVEGAANIMSPLGVGWPIVYAFLGGLAPVFVASLGGCAYALIGLLSRPPAPPDL